MVVARRLGVDEPLDTRPRYPLKFDRTENMAGEMREFEVRRGSAAVGQRVMDLKLPADVLILLIRRGQRFLVPKGQTRIESGDTLLVLAEGDLLKTTRDILDAEASADDSNGRADWQAGPDA
ncbi:MAG: hypothetical protein GX591_16075 [Planctomycetes bacterium]|nr:hypothetical protein [Planctomycetota bacterium]